MSEHTPTPWKVGTASTHIMPAHGKGAICKFESIHGMYANHDANAAFIVKAVNNHEALVKALEGIAEFSSGDDTTLGALSRLASIRNTALNVLAHVGNAGNPRE